MQKQTSVKSLVMGGHAAYKVLGVYKPPIWRAWKIGRDITDLTRNLGLKPLNAKDARIEKAPWHNKGLHAHVRKRTLLKQDGAQWHQDGDYGHVPMRHGIVLWSNKTPTEIKVDGVVFQPKPYEVVLFDNLHCFHRRPPDAPRNRWIFRQRVCV